MMEIKLDDKKRTVESVIDKANQVGWYLESLHVSELEAVLTCCLVLSNTIETTRKRADSGLVLKGQFMRILERMLLELSQELVAAADLADAASAMKEARDGN